MDEKGIVPEENIKVLYDELLRVTQYAKLLAEESKYQELGEALESRQQICNKISASSRLNELSDKEIKEIEKILHCVRDINSKIGNLIESELYRRRNTINQHANRAKVLSAYSNTLIKPSNFDRRK